MELSIGSTPFYLYCIILDLTCAKNQATEETALSPFPTRTGYQASTKSCPRRFRMCHDVSLQNSGQGAHPNHLPPVLPHQTTSTFTALRLRVSLWWNSLRLVRCTMTSPGANKCSKWYTSKCAEKWTFDSNIPGPGSRVPLRGRKNVDMSMNAGDLLFCGEN